MANKYFPLIKKGGYIDKNRSMANQLEFNAREQKKIAQAIMIISEILFSKMDKGVGTPHLQGTNTVDNEDKMLVFEITAKRKEVVNG